jgi:phage-related protein
MPLDIPTDLIIEKNKLFPGSSLNNRASDGVDLPVTFGEDEFTDSTDDVWETYAIVELLEIQHQSGGYTRIVNNAEDVTWGGHTWTRFKFEPGDITEGDDSEDKSVTVRVSNIATYTDDGDEISIRTAVESDSNHMIGDTVIYRRVHTKYQDDYLNEAYFQIVEIQDQDEWMVFELGVENFYLRQFPAHVFRRNICRYAPWQTDVCRYTDSSSCDRSFATCISLEKSSIFGGQPGIPGGVWVVS